VQKPLIVFIIAFALSIGLTVLPLVPRTVILQSTISQSISINTLINLFFSLIGLAIFFAVFYFLASNNKVIASKSTITALLLAVTLGVSNYVSAKHISVQVLFWLIPEHGCRFFSFWGFSVFPSCFDRFTVR
jgi:hypothetical protein